MVAAFLTVIGCAGRGNASPPASPPPPSAPAPTSTASSDSAPSWLMVDSAGRAATLTLEVTAARRAPSALINGYRAGEARITVPLGWTAAFSNAMTRMGPPGLPSGATDQTTFAADEAGWYWLMCGVPGHALKGEWLELRVDPDAKTAVVQVRK